MNWSKGWTTKLSGREGSEIGAEERSQAQRSRSLSHVHKHDG